MSGNDLRAIDASFLRGLAAFSSTASGSSSSASVLSSSSSDASNVSLSLRVGAQTYANAIKGLNSLAGVLNVVESDLSKLGEVVDKMIVLAERSSKATVSDSTRSGLNRDFRKLVNEFREIVNDGSVNDEEYLTKEGLANLFRLVGLDEASSKGIAAIFERFTTPEAEDAFASEKTKGSRPVVVQGTAVAQATTEVVLTQLSHSTGGITGGVITTSGSVYETTDNINGQNPDNVTTLGFVAVDGSEQALQWKPTQDVKLLSAHDTSGYTLFVSSEDYLGYNAGNSYEAFIADSNGVVVAQITNLGATSLDQFETGATSADGSIVYLAYHDGVGNHTLSRFDANFSFGGMSPDPADYFQTDIESQFDLAPTVFTELEVNDAGSMYAYRRTMLGSQTVMFRDMNSGDTDDNKISTVSDTYTHFGFVGGATLAAWNPTTTQLNYYEFGNGGVASYTSSGVPIEHIGFGEGSTLDGTSGFLAFSFDGGGGLNSIVGANSSFTTVEIIYTTLTPGDSIEGLSLARRSNGLFDVGLDGTIQALGDSDRELFRLSLNGVGGVAPVIRSEEVDKIFNGNIQSRPSATRTLVDLKALRKQIDDNIEALGDARQVLGKNIDLVRAAGFAFLDLSNQITGAEDASEVARRLQSEIRRNAGAALSQAENLKDIAFAALGILDNDEDE